MIYSIRDLERHPASVIEDVRATINLRSVVIRQISALASRKTMTMAEYIAETEGPTHRTCPTCKGEGMVEHTLRSVGTIHPSSAHRCVMSIYFDLKADESVVEKIPYELAITFEIGHTLHRLAQKALHAEFGEEFADEVDVTIPEAMILHGHADGVVRGEYAKVLLEIKSIGESGFDSLKGPKDEHVLQASIYAHALDCPFISFLYISKGAKHPIKEFVIPYKAHVYNNWVKEVVHPLDRALETGKPPVAKATKYECENCKYNKVCPQRIGGKDKFAR